MSNYLCEHGYCYDPATVVTGDGRDLFCDRHAPALPSEGRDKTSYRDRVDRMAAAIVGRTNSHDPRSEADSIARVACNVVEAIDAEIANRGKEEEA